MAYDKVLADRVRLIIESNPSVTEQQMFGGLAFLVNGHMAIAASGQGGIMVHVDPNKTEALLSQTSAELMVMRDRAMRGWLRLTSDQVTTDNELAKWVEIGVKYATSRPPKIR